MANDTSKLALPTAASDGQIMLGAGKRVRQSVMTVYHMLGGDQRMKEWAEKNLGEFYTKLYAKMMTKEVEHKVDDSVEDLLDRLDGREPPKVAHVVDAEVWPVPAQDAEFAPVVVGDDVDDGDEA